MIGLLQNYFFRADIAQKYGVNEAVFLNNIVYWTMKNAAEERHFYEARYWTYGSRKGYAKLYPFWSEDQIKRIISSLKDRGALLVGDFNEDRMIRVKWYSPSDEILALYDIQISKDGAVQNRPMHWAKSPNGTGKIAQCLYNEKQRDKDNIPPIPPKGGGGAQSLFDRFWRAYPKKKGKQDARKAWDKLSPDMDLCRVMAAALERQKRSRDWLREDGRYIPYPATWLRGRRWEDEPDEPIGPDGIYDEEGHDGI